MNVTTEINEYRERSLSGRTPEVTQIVSQFSRQLDELKLGDNALKTGDKCPQFILKDIFGKEFDSQKSLEKGKLVIAFYRGGWCPYCNIELRGYQSIYDKIKASGAEIVAISPEKPTIGEALARKHELSFPILFDEKNQFAKKLKLVFKMSPELIHLYKDKFKIDVEESQGNTDFELPIPATYIVDTDGTIIYDYVNRDYTYRLDPQEVLKHL
ncbi:MAG: peroxiredoxin-like family protein [Treponemataceae bacterium]